MTWTLPTEPELEVDEIQGHVAIGFGAAEQALGAFTARDLRGLGRVVGRWAELGRVTSARRLMRRKGRPAREVVAGSGPWCAIGVSSRLLKACQIPAELDDEWFATPGGMTGVTSLNDPRPPHGGPFGSDWVVGSPNAPVDALLIAAAGSESAAREVIDIFAVDVGDAAALSFKESLKPIVGSREHFGFRDGISQPAILGKVDGIPFDSSRQPDNGGTPYTLDAQQLIWPGEFFFGYPCQTANPRDAGALSGPQDPATHAICRNGSMLVYRRLAQDVPAFRAFCLAQSTQVKIDPDQLAGLFVGRHKSGVPISGASDVPFDSRLHNRFVFENDDMEARCPAAAHIRKVNPRLGGSDVIVVPRILRRGAPYGPVYSEDEDDQSETGRGLAFMSYQTSIQSQFGHITREWMNDDVAPNGSGGHDMVVGQVATGMKRNFEAEFEGTSFRVDTAPADRWVTLTGGAFLFAPSMSTLVALQGTGP